MKNDKYVAMLFDIIWYDEGDNIILYKPKKVISECNIDLNSDVLTKNDKKYYPMESKEILDKHLKKCYGFPLPLSDINTIFKDKDKSIDKDEEMKEIVDNYFLDLYFNIYFGAYHDENKNFNVIIAEKDDIKNYGDSSWFYNFKPSDDSDIFDDMEDDDVTYVSIPAGTIKNIVKELENGNKKKIEDYFRRIYKSLNTGDDIPDLQDNLKDKLINMDDAIKNSKEVLDELNSLIGLQNVKKNIKDLYYTLNFLNKVKDVTNIKKPNLNMVFTGNPGTGKTTVARLYAKLLNELGYTRNNTFKELTSKDLIGVYVGETAEKTAKALKDARGGVVFLDEAYALAIERKGYEKEAIAEIIKEMEKGTIFIFAGYKKEMNDFVNLNPGLESRIGSFIDFKDYTNSELLDMFKEKFNKTKMIFDNNLDSYIINIIEEARKNRNFGNGRFIDKLFDKIIIKHAANTDLVDDSDVLKKVTEDDVKTLSLDEFTNKKEEVNEIGFAYTKK